MKTPSDVLSRLPELPRELFELGAKFDYSKTAPVITNHPEVVTVDPPVVATPRIVRSHYETRIRFGWATYPKVVCYPFNDEVAVAALKLEDRIPDSRGDRTDLGAIAGARRYYKLSGFGGQDAVFGCEVRYGPWFAKVTETQSCDDQIPDMWQLEIPDLDIEWAWWGTWDDRLSVPNLVIWLDLNSIAEARRDCCAGFYFCPASQSCIPNSIDCPDGHPA